MENTIEKQDVETVTEPEKKLSSAELQLDVKKEEKRAKVRKIIYRVFVYIFLTIVAILSFLPFYWMVISSLKNETEIRQTIPTFFPTDGIHFANYGIVINYDDSLFLKNLLNTLIIGITSTGLGVIVTILTAYAFAKLKFKGRDALFSLMLATMMIPGELFTITNMLTVADKPVGFGWRNSYVVLILPFLVSFYYIYLLRNAFKQIPDSLYQAAKVDGCGEMGYLIKVMVPLTAPTLISVTLLKFIGTWNSYIWPDMVNGDNRQMLLISNWVMGGFQDIDGVVNPGMTSETLTSLKMAAACMVTLPLVILFIFFRKYIMSGVSKSGTKG